MSYLKIAINGHGGSGKTSLSNELGVALAQAFIKHGDDYFSYTTLRFEQDECNKDFIAKIAANNNEITHFSYDHATKTKLFTTNKGIEIVIFEGVGSWRDAFKVNWDIKIWVDEDKQTCMTRMSAREEAGFWPEGTPEKWWQEEVDLFTKENHKKQADLTLDCNTTLEDRVEKCLVFISKL